MIGQTNGSLSLESPIYTVPELTRIVRVAGDHVPIKVRFSVIHKSIAEISLARMQEWQCCEYIN